MTDQDPWLTLRQAAAHPLVRRTIETLRRHIKAGTLAAEVDPVSKTYRVRESALRAAYGGSPPVNAKAEIDAVRAE